MIVPARKPQYAQVAEHLISMIREGRIKPGAMLPPEPELCSKYGVSRITVRAAMRELQLQGLISRRAGVGTRVESGDSAQRFVHVASTVEDFVQSLVALTFKTLESNSCIADAALAKDTGFAPGQALLHVVSQRVDAKGSPLILTEHWLPEVYAPVVAAMEGNRGSLASRIAQSIGEEIGEVRQVIDAISLDARRARLLKTRPGKAALETKRIYLSESARLLLGSRGLSVGGRAPYEMRIRRERSKQP